MKKADRAARWHAQGVKRYLGDPCIRKLARIAESWGGRFQFMDADTIFKCVDRDYRRSKKRPKKECYYSHTEGADEASYVVTTHWRRKVFYLSPEFCSNPKPVLGYLVHEMGHVFADPKPPDASDELTWLGWEIALARWAGCYASWDEWKSNGFSLGKKKHLPRDIAELWKKYDDRICQGACTVCCGHAPDYIMKRPSPLDAWAEWGDLNEKGKRILTRDRVQHGLTIGIIDPTTRRPLPVQRQPEVQ